MADKGNDFVPESGSGPYDEPTLKMRRDRPAMLESDDDFGIDPSSFGSAPYDPPSYDDTAVVGRDVAYAPVEVATPDAPQKVRRGTLDLGLLILRLVVGATLVVHGLQKLTGMWNGPGLDGFEETLRAAGYREPGLLAIAGTVGELAAGGFLVLGLLTPFAAAAVVAIAVNAVLYKHDLEPGLQYFASETSGFEYEVLLVAVAVALTLTGPGRIALDGRRGWATRPFIGSFLVLLVGVAAGVCLWLFGR